jgi:hypothetical protein
MHCTGRLYLFIRLTLCYFERAGDNDANEDRKAGESRRPKSESESESLEHSSGSLHHNLAVRVPALGLRKSLSPQPCMHRQRGAEMAK